MDLGEVSPTHAKVREDIPSEQVDGRSDRAKSTRAGRSRPLLPDRLLLNSYIPPQGQVLPMEEVSASGLESAHEIINRWRPFNLDESLAAHMHQLYLALLRMPIDVQAEGRGEEYYVPVPTYVSKDDLT